MAEDLEDAWCVVTYNSSAGIEALLAGVPVICDEIAYYAELCETDPRQVEAVELPSAIDRWELLSRLAYVQWSLEEMASGEAVPFILPYVFQRAAMESGAMMRKLVTAIFGVVLLACASSAQIQPTDLVYEGVMAPPRISEQVPRYGYGMWGLQYDPTCAGQPDPSPADGYPGCLAATSHKEYDMVGMFDVVPPSTEHGGDYNLVPVAQQVVPFFKCSLRSNGTDIQSELLAESDSAARDIPGLTRTPSGRWICTCGHDWYNTGEKDYLSHCWFDFEPSNPDARGAYGWGAEGDWDTHSQRMAEYLGVIPQDWADANLGADGEPWCYTGMQRRGGGKPHWSPGPAIYAIPCSQPVEPERAQLLTSVELMGWHGHFPMSTSERPHPEWTPITHTRGVEWVGDTLIASVAQGGDFWWYGKPDPWTDPDAHRNTCFFNAGNPVWRDGTSCAEEWLSYGPDLPPGAEDHCGRNKGHHAIMNPAGPPQWGLQLQFYAAASLAAVAAENRDPSEIVPYATITAPDWGWRDDCAAPGGITAGGGRLYLVELNRDRPVVHVFRLGESQPPIPYCGDGNCDAPGEAVCNCPDDCGQPPVEDCTDGIDNDCDELVDCDDMDCTDDPICVPAPDFGVLRAADWSKTDPPPHEIA